MVTWLPLVSAGGRAAAPRPAPLLLERRRAPQLRRGRRRGRLGDGNGGRPHPAGAAAEGGRRQGTRGAGTTARGVGDFGVVCRFWVFLVGFFWVLKSDGYYIEYFWTKNWWICFLFSFFLVRVWVSFFP